MTYKGIVANLCALEASTQAEKIIAKGLGIDRVYIALPIESDTTLKRWSDGAYSFETIAEYKSNVLALHGTVNEWGFVSLSSIWKVYSNSKANQRIVWGYGLSENRFDRLYK